MRQSIFIKKISLLLVLTMLMPLASMTFASDTAEEMGLMAIGGDGDSQLFGGGFTGWGLKTLAGGTISGLVGIGLNQAYKQIFGSDTDRIMAAIKELSNQISQIDAKIDSIIRKMDIKEINDFLNDYRKSIAPYKVLYKELQTAKELYGGNDSASIAKKNQFLLDIYYGNDPSLKRYGDNIMGIVREIRSMLVDDIRTVNGIPCNVFGAFDILEKYVNRWENQGYDIRSEFRNTALGVFTDFAALAELACDAVIIDCKNRNDAAGLQRAELAQTNLKKHETAVDAMATRCAVIKHPDYRIFRDTEKGFDKYIFYARVDPAHVKSPNREERELSHYLIYGTYIYCMTTTNHIISYANRNGGIEVISAQVWCGDLIDVHRAYGGKKTLYEIFFDPKEGNFINVGGLGKGTRFATDYYIFIDYSSYNILNREELYMTRWDTNVVNDNGNLNESVRLLRISRNSKSNSRTVDHLLQEKFFSVIKYRGVLNQGAVQSPVPQIPESATANMISGMESSYDLPYTDSIELSVEEKDNATYQWFVDMNEGSGFVEIENATSSTYTLPTPVASMNGWKYQCAIIEDEVSEWGAGYTLADPVTLVLTGEGIPALVTVHEVGTPEELETALGKVSDGSWEGHTIKLTADITYPNPITIINHNVNFNLNGYTLTVQPNSNSQPNIDPISNNAETAAIYAYSSNIYVEGNGELNVIAGQGIDYGVYANNSQITVNNISSTKGGTGAYATNYGNITADYISAEGENTYSVMNYGGTVTVSGNVTAIGKSSCGVHADSSDGISTGVNIGGNLTVSGINSKGAYLNAGKTTLDVAGSVDVTGDKAVGIFASGNDNAAGNETYMAYIHGNVSASDVAVNASNGADVNVSGNVTSSDEASTAIFAAGGSVTVEGNVTSNGINGVGISASKWDLTDSTVGAFVKADGKITAYMPLIIESLPVGKYEHTGEVGGSGHYIYTDGTSSVWAKENSFVIINPNAQIPIITVQPKDETVVQGDEVTLSVQACVTDGGTLSYQWYSNNVNSFQGARLIADATSSSYVPPTDRVGTMYYYAVVTNTNNDAEGEKTSQVISSLADLKVVLPQYLVMGDSIAAGYGLISHADSYASIVQQETYLMPTYIIADGMTSGDLIDALNAMTSQNKTFLSEVQLVTLSIGSNDVLSPFLGIIANQLQCTPDKIQETLADLSVNNPGGLAAVLEALDTETTGLKNNPLLLEGASDFANNFKGIINKLKELMPNAKIYVTNIYNPYWGISLPYGTGTLDLGAIAEGYISFLNDAFTSHNLSYTLINVNSAFKNATTPVVHANKDTFNFDPHPNKDGHELIADLILSDYENVPSYTYTVKFMDGNKVYATKVVSAPATVIDSMPHNPAKRDYIFSGWYTGTNGTGKPFIASTPVTSDITLYAYWTKTSTRKSNVGATDIIRHTGAQVKSFADVKESDWFYNAVIFCAEKGITNGTSETTFSPHSSLTRGQFITMLLKAYNIEPLLYITDNFFDAGDTYYTGYLAAAKAKGLSNGVGDNKFDPERSITREEMFALLYNTLKVLNKLPDSNNGKTLADFTDNNDIASWAIEAITVLVKTGTVNGNGSKLSPKSAVTRTEMAQVLYNLLSKPI